MKKMLLIALTTLLLSVASLGETKTDLHCIGACDQYGHCIKFCY